MSESRAAYFREYRARQGARTGQIGRPVTEPCGTSAAYKRHRKAGEQPCEPCRLAWNAKQRELYQARKARNGT